MAICNRNKSPVMKYRGGVAVRMRDQKSDRKISVVRMHILVNITVSVIYR